MSKEDKGFLDTVKSLWTTITTHISDAVKHITSAERTLWNTVTDKLDKSGDTMTSTLNINNAGELRKGQDDKQGIVLVGNEQVIIRGGNLTTRDLKISNTHFEFGGQSIYHAGNLTKVSQLSNDAGFITQTDIDTSPNHTHANKAVLDGITSNKVSSWDNKLLLDGGKVTGKTKFSQGTNVAYMPTTTLSGFYKHVAKITVRQQYQNQPITFKVYQRARFGIVIVEFKNANTNDPELRRFTKIGEVEAYLYKSATSTWELYIKMTEQYDCIDIMEFNKGEYMNLVNVTWTTDTLEALPTGCVTASRQYIDVAAERSNKDSDGNQINTTYVKKSDTNSTPFYKATELSANSYKVTTSFSRTFLDEGYKKFKGGNSN